MNFAEGRARCDQDSADASVSGFLHMPMPRSEAEQQIYFDLVKDRPSSTFLDITEVFPKTNPRTWALKDGSLATWFNWLAGEPNDSGNGEPNVELLRDWGPGGDRLGNWNDLPGNLPRNIVCSYFLPAGAENNCPWLTDFQD